MWRKSRPTFVLPGNKRKDYLLRGSLFVFLLLGQRTGVSPVRGSTLLEFAFWVAAWRKPHPVYVYRTRKLRPSGPMILGAQAPGKVESTLQEYAL